MQSIKVRQGQGFFDVVVEQSGNIFNSFLIASKNDRSITEMIEVGAEIEIVGDKRQKITQQFNNGHYLATASHTNEDVYNEYGLPLTFPII